MIKNCSYLLLSLLLLPCVAAAELSPEVDRECRRIGAKLGSVSYRDCASLNLKATTGKSVKNATILMKE
ncbi:MAG: murein peptide amidase A, partial [Gammaproteobacteria bacterium]|nr:murein peptide amidase A [Gammaproteobacteria bacterium]